MREHIGLFRGKAAGEWLTGYLLVYGGECQIWHDIENGKWNYAVDPDTVGECTGLTDRNGKLIFEGDVLAINGHKEYPVVVRFETGSYSCRSAKDKHYLHRLEYSSGNKYEVIGNIHDTPELIGGST